MPIQWQTEDGKLFYSLRTALNHCAEADLTEPCNMVVALQADTTTSPAEFEQFILELQQKKDDDKYKDVYFNTDGSFLVDKIRIMQSLASGPFWWEIRYHQAKDDPDNLFPILCIYDWYD